MMLLVSIDIKEGATFNFAHARFVPSIFVHGTTARLEAVNQIIKPYSTTVLCTIDLSDMLEGCILSLTLHVVSPPNASTHKIYSI